MSSRLMPPNVGSSAATMSMNLRRVLRVDLEVEDVDVGELLEQAGLALHHRLAGERADVAQPQHRGAVGDHRDQVAARGVLPRPISGFARDLQARLGDAGRIRERQIALGDQRLGRDDLDLSRPSNTVIVERVLFPDHLYSGDVARCARLIPRALGWLDTASRRVSAAGVSRAQALGALGADDVLVGHRRLGRDHVSPSVRSGFV